MPVTARMWAQALPYTHYIRLQTEQLQMAAPLRASAPTLGALLLAAAILLGLSAPLLDRLSRQPAQWGKR
jgi:ABC-2 type transport system permease protein